MTHIEVRKSAVCRHGRHKQCRGGCLLYGTSGPIVHCTCDCHGAERWEDTTVEIRRSDLLEVIKVLRDVGELLKSLQSQIEQMPGEQWDQKETPFVIRRQQGDDISQDGEW